MSKPVIQMLNSAKKLDKPTVARAQTALVRVESAIQRGSQLLEGLLGIEASSKESLKKKLGELKLQKEEKEKVVAYAGNAYSMLSLKPLRWRDKAGRPKLVVYGLESPVFEIRVQAKMMNSWSERRTYSTIFQPQLPKVIADCYDDIVVGLRETAVQDRRGLRLTCEFTALIPDDVKKKIVEAQGDFERIFIISEPGEFKLTKERRIAPKRQQAVNKDPIVAGYSKGVLWLIASFDTTSVEEAMLNTPTLT